MVWMSFCSLQPSMHWPETVLLERFKQGISVSHTYLVQCLGTLENHGALFPLAECSSTREDMPSEKALFFKCSNPLNAPSKLSVFILCLSDNCSRCCALTIYLHHSALFIAPCDRLKLGTHLLWFFFSHRESLIPTSWNMGWVLSPVSHQ